MQCRIYSENGSFVPTDQWAQVTVKKIGKDANGKRLVQYAVFERRCSDKIEPYDWKISLIAEASEFETLFDEKAAKK